MLPFKGTIHLLVKFLDYVIIDKIFVISNSEERQKCAVYGFRKGSLYHFFTSVGQALPT